MVTHKKVADYGLKLGKAPPLEVTAYNGRMMLVEAGYHMPLRTVDGEIYTIFPYGVDQIATDIMHSITDKTVVEKIPEVWWEDLQGLTGTADMLIRFDKHGMFPVEKVRRESMAL
jgi:hypothetical protein